MAKLDPILAGRKRGASIYDRLFQNHPFLLPPSTPQGFVHAYQSYVVLLTDLAGKFPRFESTEKLNRKRNKLMMELEESGISVRQGTHAVHTLGYYKKKYGLNDADFPCSFMADRLSITLPLYYDFSEEDGELVLEKIREKTQ
jgi:dTDP-4-amino-4,6-dideoxygalactose transaminase